MSTDKLKVNLSNPQRTYLWEVIIPNPVGDGDTEAFTLRCQSASRPGRTFGRIHIDYKQGPGFNVPGKSKYDQSWNVTVLEGEDALMHEFLYSWQQQIVNDKTELGNGDALIKRDLYLRLLSTKGTETKKIKLIGSYPENVPDTPLAMTGEDAVRYNCTFCFDKWIEV
jgi:hypothetical protein